MANPSNKVDLNVSPHWAENAISLTSASLEISFDQLRELYYSADGGQGSPDEGALKTVSITLTPKFTADIDSRSINDQKQATIQHWEQKFSAPDTQLYPKSPSSDSISKSNVKVVHTPVIKATDYSDVGKPGLKDHESAIEREIRLAQEREAELKRERAKLAQLHESGRELKVDTDSKQTERANKTAMPIHKLPVLTSPKSPDASSTVTSQKQDVAKQHSPQTYQEMTEVDRDAMKRESIIEREIREQLAREEELRRQAKQKSMQQPSKEAEQSEFERREKEHEKVSAHESIIEREIREQREREREVTGIHSHGHPAGQTVVISSQIKESGVQSQQSAPPRLPTTTPPKTNMRNSYSEESGSEKEAHIENVYDPNTGRIDKTITYVDAISSCAHPGESLIARELREQREREEELRSQWKSSGMDVPLATQEPPDTPFNMPDPRQPPMSRMSQHKDSSNHLTVDVRRVSMDSVSSVNTEHSYVDKRDSTQQVQQNKPKVQPYVDEDDEDDFQYRFVPLTETPVEKEIRLAREREEALRAERGFPTSGHEDVTREVVIDVATPARNMSYSRRVSESDHGTMKRLASSRLQQEMIKEKQREVELKQTGNIVTISEERVGELMNYKDIIPKEPVNPPTPKTPNYAQPNASAPKQANSSPPKQSSVDDLDYSHNQNGSVIREVPKQHTPKAPVVLVTTTPAQQRPQPVNSRPEPVNSTRVEPVSYSRSHSGGPVVSKSAVNAESMIERELREQREREEELRRQRQMVLSGKPQTTVLPPRDHDVIEDQPTIYRLVSSQSDDVTLRQENGSLSAEAKGLRRKSALAEEWERKFGASS